jgi:hypothetical protein
VTGLVALCSGSGAEVHTFAESRYREQLTGVGYTGGTVELNGADGVWVPEGTPRRRLAAHAAGLQALLERGGTVLLFGDHQAGWPATVRWTYRPAGGAGDTVLPSTEHGFAGELLHAATIAIVGDVPLDTLWHAVPAFPTLSEVWLRLLEAERGVS